MTNNNKVLFSLWPTAARREHLVYSKDFLCVCDRLDRLPCYFQHSHKSKSSFSFAILPSFPLLSSWPSACHCHWVPASPVIDHSTVPPPARSIVTQRWSFYALILFMPVIIFLIILIIIRKPALQRWSYPLCTHPTSHAHMIICTSSSSSYLS